MKLCNLHAHAPLNESTRQFCEGHIRRRRRWTQRKLQLQELEASPECTHSPSEPKAARTIATRGGKEGNVATKSEKYMLPRTFEG
mmetsp:Transcript_67140/g.146039  ORF Transcript_67140/g.146039 Transcript_67140/m.146039 type:complete len:85 (-) Transcript_67140:643-897(-)